MCAPLCSSCSAACPDNHDPLYAQAKRLAHLLRAKGIGLGQRVGLFIERSLAMFEGLLGTQKSGAAYVPLDPAYSAERVRATLILSPI
jgi:non-ribosomal peptide synthetase component F